MLKNQDSDLQRAGLEALIMFAQCSERSSTPHYDTLRLC